MPVLVAPPEKVSHIADDLFRRESSRLVAILTGIFGAGNLQLAEDVVQEALVRALQTWPYHGIPQNPPAWLMQTARNLALDVVRREKRFRDKHATIVETFEHRTAPAPAPGLTGELGDDQLRLLFTCCHPVLTHDDQVALSLKTLCGFSATEIANGFFATEAAILKRLTRARKKLASEHVTFEIPDRDELPARLDAVHRILYLFFNEGYKASAGPGLVRSELCDEAIRLADLLPQNPATNTPTTHALLSLMLLHHARAASRTSMDGNLMLLCKQDRGLWNRDLIRRGILHLDKSAQGDEVSEYHFQAGIAAQHCLADSIEATDWDRILMLYDYWLHANPSPVIALNRAVAVSYTSGPAAAIDEVMALCDQHEIEGYYLVEALLGDFHARLGQPDRARKHYAQAAYLAANETEKHFLQKQADTLQE